MDQRWGPAPQCSDLIGLAAQVAQVKGAPFTEKTFTPRVPPAPGAQGHCAVCERGRLSSCRLVQAQGEGLRTLGSRGSPGDSDRQPELRSILRHRRTSEILQVRLQTTAIE